jgi:hypothetical protein
LCKAANYFSAGTVDGLPPGTKVTSSFGVAARTADEGLEPLMRRADEALYKAKRNGRDSVRLSYERPETIFVILAHRHRSRWSMQKHNKLFLSAAKSRANIDVSQRAGTAPPFGRCRAPPPNQCADHDNLARWPGMVPSALILPSALPTVSALPPIAVSESSL